VRLLFFRLVSFVESLIVVPKRHSRFPRAFSTLNHRRDEAEFEMTSRRIFLGFALLLASAAPSPNALAQPEAKAPSTLQQVRKRGAVVCGVAAPSPGFAQQDAAGGWSGFDIDFCRALATAAFDDPGKIRVAPLAVKERLAALQSGAIDVLLRGAPWTEARDAGQQLLYTTITFYGGQGFLARRKPEPQNAGDIENAAVCLQQGTSLELDLADFFRARGADYKPRLFPSLDEAVKAYDAGQCDLVSADIAVLHVARAKLSRPGDHTVLSDLITKAPAGPIVRQGDDQWFNIVRWTHFAMLNAEELGINSANADDALRSESPDMRRLLGVDGDFGEGLGLSADWAYRVIKQVGNYGEVFERDLGQGSPLAMERRQNALWSKGGLMYAPPVR
jgi:general L-amino acid transport system substrate-binding protein